MVAIELATRRSVRRESFARAVNVGYGRFRQDRGDPGSKRGESGSFRRSGRRRRRCRAWRDGGTLATLDLRTGEAKFLLQILIVALDGSPQLGGRHQVGNRRFAGQ